MTINEFKTSIYSMAENQSIKLQILEEFIIDFYRLMPLPIANLKPEIIVRCSINNPGEVFNNISRCSYNPNNKKIGLQRCNYPEQQVFYAAVPSLSNEMTTIGSAIMEVMTNTIIEDDMSTPYLTLSRWRLKRELNVYVFPFVSDIDKKNPALNDALSNYHKILDELPNDISQETKTLFIDSLKFISKCLCEIDKREIHYRITSAFYNGIMKLAKNRNLILEGMVYPSANTLKAGTNVVIVKELIDNEIIFCDEIIMYATRRNPSNLKDINFVDVSNRTTPDNNGNFHFEYIK